QLKDDPLRPQGTNGLIVQIYGFDQQKRKKYVEYAESMMKNIDGIQNVFSSADKGRTELRVKMNRGRITRLGLTTSQVATVLSNAVKGNQATNYLSNGIQYDVVVRLKPIETTSVADLNNIQVHVSDSTFVPLGSVASIHRYKGPA